MENFIAIDLGGTNVRAALVNEKGEMAGLIKERTRSEDVINQLVELIGRLKKATTVSGAGIGVPGAVDREGRLRYVSNLPILEGKALGKELTERTGMPVNVVNDGNAAALAEALLGAGKGLESVYYVTVSTGIGGGFVYQGKLMSGAAGFAGEVGGTIVRRQETESFRGLYPGAIEGLSAGDALTERGSRLSGRKLAHAGEVFEAADQGEDWALMLIDEMAKDLAVMFAGISFAINPDIFVVGGGCMKRQDCFFEKMQKYFLKMTPEGLHTTRFAPASLEEPGLLGAALLKG